MKDDRYFPPPETEGGWRRLSTGDEVRELAGMDPMVLDLLGREQELLASDSSYGIVIVRNGYLVREYYSFNVSPTTRFDVWSCTKSLTSTAWGVGLAESAEPSARPGPDLALETPVYDLIPEGHPLTDPRKAQITIGHLLQMTSGIRGESRAAYGCVTTPNEGPFEYALGRCPNRFGVTVAELAAEPGTTWDYSDAAFAHLSLAFVGAFGVEMAEFLAARVLFPIGIREFELGAPRRRGLHRTAYERTLGLRRVGA